MKTNIFISRPSRIADKYERQYTPFDNYLSRKGFIPQRLGSSQFSLDAPLKGVIDIMKQCRGAIVLGYPQYEIATDVKKSGKKEKSIYIHIPTPWNQIEGTLAFYKNLPVLVVAHTNVSGGIFDIGVTGQFVLNIDLASKDWYNSDEFQGIFKEWKKRIK